MGCNEKRGLICKGELRLLAREARCDGEAHPFRRRGKIQLPNEAGLVRVDDFHGPLEQGGNRFCPLAFAD